jgi:hypothetical protein
VPQEPLRVGEIVLVFSTAPELPKPTWELRLSSGQTELFLNRPIIMTSDMVCNWLREHVDEDSAVALSRLALGHYPGLFPNG